MVLTVLLPSELHVLPTWLLLLIEAVLLVSLIIADPGQIDRRSNRLRRLPIALLAVLA
jgi:hypothetical protein